MGRASSGARCCRASLPTKAGAAPTVPSGCPHPLCPAASQGCASLYATHNPEKLPVRRTEGPRSRSTDQRARPADKSPRSVLVLSGAGRLDRQVRCAAPLGHGAEQVPAGGRSCGRHVGNASPMQSTSTGQQRAHFADLFHTAVCEHGGGLSAQLRELCSFCTVS
eukprot:COSAG06_NODE_19631_length_830_cov_0.755130_2_plen_165_part_01